ncbi:MAG: hypothetical protein ACLS8R_05460 [Anaeromassilibacillus sp.]
MEQIEGRLDQLYRLGLKYGGSVEEMLAFLEDCKKQLSDIELSDAHIARLTKEHQEAEAEAWRCAKALSAKRQEVAALFAKRVQEELTFLDMPNVTFLVQREEGALSPRMRSGTVLISTNPANRLSHWRNRFGRRAFPDHAGDQDRIGGYGSHRNADL